MPIDAYYNDGARLRVHKVSGRVTASEFNHLFQFYAAHPRIAETDLISFIDEACDPALTIADIEALRAAFRDMQLTLDPPVIQRSVWVCPSVRAWPMLEVWLRDRHSRDGLSTEVFLVARLEDAVCAFDENELAVVHAWSDFRQLGRFDATDLPVG
ncbi:MAG: hypothetical protein AB7H66_07395 [Hyphomonadaceae bacterium]